MSWAQTNFIADCVIAVDGRRDLDRAFATSRLRLVIAPNLYRAQTLLRDTFDFFFESCIARQQVIKAFGGQAQHFAVSQRTNLKAFDFFNA